MHEYRNASIDEPTRTVPMPESDQPDFFMKEITLDCRHHKVLCIQTMPMNQRALFFCITAWHGSCSCFPESAACSYLSGNNHAAA